MTEAGYAGEAEGEHTLRLLHEVLARAEATGGDGRAMLRVDYARYKGTCNAIRRRLVSEILSRPTLSAVAFVGMDFVSRAQARLLPVVAPHLEVGAFPDEADALDWLRGRARRDPTPTLPVVASPYARNAGFLWRHVGEETREVVGGRSCRVIRPQEWHLDPASTVPEVTFLLVEGDILWTTHTGAMDVPGARRRQQVERAVLDSLGHREIHLVLDARGVTGLSPRAWMVHLRFLRPYRHQVRGLVLLGAAPRPPFAGPWLAWMLGLGRRIRWASTDEEAWRAVDGLRASPGADGLTPFWLPKTIRARLDRQHTEIVRYQRSQGRLLDYIARISQEASHGADAAAENPTLDQDDPLISVHGALHWMHRDINALLDQRARQVAELQEARRAAEAANRSRQDFLGVVSHELRTPLNAIMGLVSLLEGSPLSAGQRRHLQGIRAATLRQARLVEDLLDSTCMESGRFTLHPTPFPMPDLLAELHATMEPQARQKRLALTFPPLDVFRGHVLGDRERIFQVLQNLLENAVKYTPAGSVALTAAALDNSRWRFVVRDTGPGIPPSHLERIFIPFERLDSPDGRVIPGIGLGLPICRALATAMGGSLTVESTHGEGSAVVLDLPLPPATPIPALDAPAPSRTAAPLDGLRILLVEDDPPSRYVAAEILRLAGARITEATDGAEAVRAFQPSAFDLVLMDCQLPVLDGYEATRQIRAAEPTGIHTPVVALTAWDLGDNRAWRAAGMDGSLSKPIHPQRLVAWIQEHHGRPAAAEPLPAPPKVHPATVPLLDLETVDALDRATGLDIPLRLFEDTAPRVIEELRTAGTDPERLRRLAHRFKGQCLTLGARRMADLCAALESEEGAPLEETWSTLEATLPATLAALEARRHRSPAPTDRRRVLVVEDDPVVGEIACRMIEAGGLDVRSCEDGATALSLQETEPPFHAVLVDQGLPDMTGWACIQALRRHQPDLRAVLWSGTADPEDLAEVARAEGVRFLLKPVSLNDLILSLAGTVPARRDSAP